jgi:hypothetical protein
MFDESIVSRRTICFPITDNEILLGMKLTGFGSGKYNGFGGKFDSLKGDLDYVGLIDFDFPAKSSFNQRVRIYFLKTWKGNPGQTEEMAPEWFNMDNIPYKKMWDSDKLWLPSLLEGKKFYAKFIWKDDNETVQEYAIKFVDVLEY